MKKATLIFLLFLPMYLSAAVETMPEDTLGEIIVVDARNRVQSESLSTPTSQIFLKQIEQQQLSTYKDMSARVPNLYIPAYGSRMTSSIYMRGLGSRIDNPVVGLYVDGVGLANKNSYDFDLFDVRSMRLYRGPQGTLFGKNTIGGVLSVETLSPLHYQGTRAAIGYGNSNTTDAKVSHYHLITDSLGFALAGYFKHTDGFFRNEYDGKKVDYGNEAGARMRLDGVMNSFTTSTTISYNYVAQGGFPYHKPDSAVNHNDFCGYTRHNLLIGSTQNITIKDYILSSTTSYQYLQDKMQMDQDYLPLSYFTLMQQQQEHYISQELTLHPSRAYIFNDKANWSWLTAFSVSYKHQSMSAPVTFKQDGIDSLILKNINNGSSTSELQIKEDEFVISSDFTTQNLDIAAYHTSQFKIGDWQLEAGLRLNFEYLRFNYLSESLLNVRIAYLNTNSTTEYVPINSKLSGVITLPYFEVLPRFAATYSKPNWKIYASVAEGYKAGGFNTQLFSDLLQTQIGRDISGSKKTDNRINQVITYRPERCLDFELGANAHKRFDNTLLDANLTLYELEVFDMQQTVFPAMGTGRYMTNAGRSRSFGMEMTGLISWKDLTFNLSYGLTRAVFVSYDSGGISYSGKYVPYAPQNTLTASLSYCLRFTHNFVKALNFNINTNAFGKIYWNESNTLWQPFYALLNANIDLQMKYLTLQLWAKNITNTKYDVFHFVSMGNTFLQSGMPITFGGRLIVEI